MRFLGLPALSVYLLFSGVFTPIAGGLDQSVGDYDITLDAHYMREHGNFIVRTLLDHTRYGVAEPFVTHVIYGDDPTSTSFIARSDMNGQEVIAYLDESGRCLKYDKEWDPGVWGHAGFEAVVTQCSEEDEIALIQAIKTTSLSLLREALLKKKMRRR